MARTFIVNYYAGKKVQGKDFERAETTPIVCARGQEDDYWQAIAVDTQIWTDEKLANAAKEFVRLVNAQRAWFKGKKAKRDRPEKALNPAVLSAWAFVAGTLANNHTRLKRHYGLSQSKGKDPLNADALDKGRHKTDAENYRGLGFRTDPRERGRLVELFYLQAEKGMGITPAVVNSAILNYHAKQGNLEALRAKEKLGDDGD